MKIRRLISLLCFLWIVITVQGQVKYVFYFIGDGMGVNQVNGTEMYRAALKGHIGTDPLLFTQFPSGEYLFGNSSCHGFGCWWNSVGHGKENI